MKDFGKLNGDSASNCAHMRLTYLYRLFRLTLASLLLVSFFGATEMLQAGAKPRPNILFIPSDDLKPLLSCYGDKVIKTPNIDRLSARGLVFRNSHCQQAICWPTQASLLTGLYPDSTGVWDLVRKFRAVNPTVVTLPQYFKEHGYLTANIGKTFDGRNTGPGQDQVSWSFPADSVKYDLDEAALEQAQRARQAYHSEKRKTSAKDAHGKQAGDGYRPATECLDLPDIAYTDGKLASHGCALLRELSASGKPFFLSVGFAKPHLPFEAPKRFWDLYQRESFPRAPFQEMATNSPAVAYHNSGELRGQYSDILDVGPLTPALQLELIHGYHACVSFVDAQVGKLLDELDRLGIADNTIICLWGDHGWHLGDHGMWCKHWNFEQAGRAPLIISAPSFAAAKSDSPVGFIDIYPTLCDLAGLPKPAHLQGLSLVPILKNPKASVREAVLSQYPRSSNGKPVMGCTLRSDRYRYVKWLQMNYAKGERSGLFLGAELYDYEKDPLETVSQVGNPDYLDVVARFEALFKEMNVAQQTGRSQQP